MKRPMLMVEFALCTRVGAGQEPVEVIGVPGVDRLDIDVGEVVVSGRRRRSSPAGCRPSPAPCTSRVPACRCSLAHNRCWNASSFRLPPSPARGRATASTSFIRMKFSRSSFPSMIALTAVLVGVHRRLLGLLLARLLRRPGPTAAFASSCAVLISGVGDRPILAPRSRAPARRCRAGAPRPPPPPTASSPGSAGRSGSPAAAGSC